MLEKEYGGVPKTRVLGCLGLHVSCFGPREETRDGSSLGSEKNIIGVCRVCVSAENKRFRIVVGWWRVGIVGERVVMMQFYLELCGFTPVAIWTRNCVDLP